MDIARRVFIACAWTVALTSPDEPEPQVAAEQLFLVICDWVALYTE